MTFLKTTTAGALCALCTTPALAQEVLDLDTITVTANQTATDLERSGSTVEVIDAGEVRASPRARIADRLTFEPGISASANGPLGTTATLRIRGLGGAYVPVLIDGIDVTDPASSGGGFDFGGLTNAGLGRIEVLKGSQSARFGLNAVGGVINIESLRPTEDGVHGFVEAEAGSFDTRRGVLGLTARTDRTDLAFTISRIETDGFSASGLRHRKRRPRGDAGQSLRAPPGHRHLRSGSDGALYRQSQRVRRVRRRRPAALRRIQQARGDRPAAVLRVADRACQPRAVALDLRD